MTDQAEVMEDPFIEAMLATALQRDEMWNRAAPPPIPWDGRPDTKLSVRQKAILLSIYRLDEEGIVTRYCCGVPIRRHSQGDSASERAAFSRALRRLEQRGLILRQNQQNGCPGPDSHGQLRRSNADPHDRTTHVQITELGKEVAKRLTNETSSLLTVSRSALC